MHNMNFSAGETSPEQARKRKKAIVAIVASVLLLACALCICVWAAQHKLATPTQENLPVVQRASAPVVQNTTALTSATETSPETTLKILKPVGTTVPETNPVQPPKKVVQTERVIPTKCLNVPFIAQGTKYPTGCESISAVMALRYAGYSISPEYFIDNCLDKGTIPYRDQNDVLFGDDPRKVFLGDPYSSTKGWGCYAPVIVKAMNRCIDPEKHAVKAFYYVPLDVLCHRYIDNEIPVLIWATQNMAPWRTGKTWYITGTSETFTWIAPMHCLLLVGYSDTHYFFNDPLQGKNYHYEKAAVRTAYTKLGGQAVVLVPADPIPTTDPPAPPPETDPAVSDTDLFEPSTDLTDTLSTAD